MVPSVVGAAKGICHGFRGDGGRGGAGFGLYLLDDPPRPFDVLLPLEPRVELPPYELPLPEIPEKPPLDEPPVFHELPLPLLYIGVSYRSSMVSPVLGTGS